jgi:hypothetical protein
MIKDESDTQSRSKMVMEESSQLLDLQDIMETADNDIDDSKLKTILSPGKECSRADQVLSSEEEYVPLF